ncbi:hypothetical protein KFK09_022315 [Dendrobium nobile]|uniref:Uncharacterized protein n=1 Tax=Dendrobium nobile TaxID=94219 RepID=A0A8T3AIP3_DENNO|nr:hypothetical protein KFK09_022315 [Dendrobium nobile]
MEAMMMKSSLMLYVIVLLLSFPLVQARDGQIAPSPTMENGAAGFLPELLLYPLPRFLGEGGQLPTLTQSR